MVSSRVSPVNTRMVSCCSTGVSVFHDWTSLDSGTFSGSQKLFTRRFQTATSVSSWILFQLIAWTWLTSGNELLGAVTRMPLKVCCVCNQCGKHSPRQYGRNCVANLE